jgi:hypothetical protein
MTASRGIQGLLMVGALGALMACTAQSQPTEMAPYARPDGWATECVGRYLFDAPSPLSVGEVPAEFEPDGKMSYRLPKEVGDFGKGSVSIAWLDLFETQPIQDTTKFGPIDKRMDFYYRIRVIRDGGPDHEEARRRANTTRHTLKWPTSLVWRSDEAIDFGIYVPEDRRARMIHGYPADTKTFPNGISGEKAKAMIESFWSRYQPRQPQTIPTKPGICTPYGFIEDPKGLTEQNYGVHVSFLHPAMPNLLLSFSVASLTDRDREQAAEEMLPIEQQETPWEWEERTAKKEKEECKQRVAGPGSRDLFGCTFAGARGIRSHRKVEYVTLGDGRKARVIVLELSSSSEVLYEVTIETAAKVNSATEPVVTLWAGGISGKSEAPAFRGKEPPQVDEVIKLLKTIAASVRLRDKAIEPGARASDTLAAFR